MVVKNQGPLYLDLTATAYHQNQDQVPTPPVSRTPPPPLLPCN